MMDIFILFTIKLVGLVAVALIPIALSYHCLRVIINNKSLFYFCVMYYICRKKGKGSMEILDDLYERAKRQFEEMEGTEQ